MSILPMATVKATLSAVLDGVESTHERVTITRNGVPTAVLVSPADLAALEESLELLSRPEVLTQLADARTELDTGQGLDAIELRAFLAAERAR